MLAHHAAVIVSFQLIASMVRMDTKLQLNLTIPAQNGRFSNCFKKKIADHVDSYPIQPTTLKETTLSILLNRSMRTPKFSSSLFTPISSVEAIVIYTYHQGAHHSQVRLLQPQRSRIEYRYETDDCKVPQCKHHGNIIHRNREYLNKITSGLVSKYNPLLSRPFENLQ